MPATLDLRRGQVVGDASRRWLGVNAVTHDVANATYAPIASPTFTGDPKAPTAAPGDNDTSVANTAFVSAAITAAPNHTITLSGDINGSGTAAIATTLPTVNGNVGTFQGLTVNAKGQVTAAANQGYAPLASPAFTGTPTVNGAAFAAGHLPGTTTNDAAAAGQVGEVVSGLVTTGVTLATTVATNLTSISLTAGDWDVWGEVWFSGTGSTVQTGSISPTSATGPGLGLATASFYVSFTSAIIGAAMVYPLAPARISLAAPATYYLVVTQIGSASMTMTGKLVARRAR